MNQKGKHLLGAGKSDGGIAGEDTPRISEHKDGSLRKKLAENGRRRVKVKSENSKNPFLNHVDYVD